MSEPVRNLCVVGGRGGGALDMLDEVGRHLGLGACQGTCVCVRADLGVVATNVSPTAMVLGFLSC